MDLYTGHTLITLLEMLDEDWNVVDWVVKDDDSIVVELHTENPEGITEVKMLYFDRKVNKK